MNKLIVSMASLCVAFATHAAAVGWTCAGATGYSNYGMFVINQNGVTSVDQITSIVAASGLTGVEQYMFGSGALNNGVANVTAVNSGKSITYSGSGIDTYSGFVIVEDAKGEKASASGLAQISMDNDATSKSFLFGNQDKSFANNSFDVGGSPVPEPTSGLLLILGMAGLALRRRRA